MSVHGREDEATELRPDILIDDLDATTDPNRILTRIPKEPFRLSYVDVACFIINRMIGMLNILSKSSIELGLIMVSNRYRYLR